MSKLILSQNGAFVGKGYSSDEMVKLFTVLDDSCINNKKNDVSVYMLDSISLWHQRLTHVGLSTMKRMVKCGLISFDVNEFKKWELCVKSKMIKKPFKSVERNTNLPT